MFGSSSFVYQVNGHSFFVKNSFIYSVQRIHTAWKYGVVGAGHAWFSCSLFFPNIWPQCVRIQIITRSSALINRCHLFVLSSLHQSLQYRDRQTDHHGHLQPTQTAEAERTVSSVSESHSAHDQRQVDQEQSILEISVTLDGYVACSVLSVTEQRN